MKRNHNVKVRGKALSTVEKIKGVRTKQEIISEQMDAKEFFKRGLAYGRQGNHSQAAWEYGKAIVCEPDYANAYNNRGVERAEEGYCANAIDCFTRAIAINPNDPDFYFNRGLAYQKAFYQRQKPKSLTQEYFREGLNVGRADFNKATELNSDYGKMPIMTIGMPLQRKLVCRTTVYRVKS